MQVLIESVSYELISNPFCPHTHTQKRPKMVQGCGLRGSRLSLYC